MNLRTQFTKLDCDKFRAYCNFTPNELDVFELCTKAKSIVEISLTLNISTATVDRRIRSIKKKINRVLSFKLDGNMMGA